MMNAKSCYAWLQSCLKEKNLKAHFIAVTAQTEKAQQWGIPAEQIFPIWDWVGGRYSVWSAIGLPLALQIGMSGFHEFLQGAHQADQHFRGTELKHNIPVIMALLGVWYLNFFAAPTQAIIPYSHHLRSLRAYIQQLDMESNGKRITRQGQEADYLTGPIVWGELGIHGQHAFHQLLHQGMHLVPVDFILAGSPKNAWDHHQDLLIANALSQARALMCGKAEENKHKEIPGNRPSNIFFMNKLSPQNLGALLAFYEHKVFVQSVIWDVNPFDQWGVELGKSILPDVMQDLDQENVQMHDASTHHLIKHYKNLRVL